MRTFFRIVVAGAAVLGLMTATTPALANGGASGGQAAAQPAITYPTCSDILGRQVASVQDNSINDVAIATLAHDGSPIIKDNTTILAGFQPQTRLFIYAHECGHHVLGHIIGHGYAFTAEQHADCWGIVALVRHQMISVADLRVIQHDMTGLGDGDWMHLPGPQRALNLEQCLLHAGITIT